MTDVAAMESDAAFMNKFSRMIGAYGVEIMAKLRRLDVLVQGLDGSGIELCKNVTLSGPNSLTIVDPNPATIQDLGVNFFLSEDDIGKARAEACAPKLRDLNSTVVVKVAGELTEDLVLKSTILVLCNPTKTEILKWNAFCRSHRKNDDPQNDYIAFICTSVYGVAGSVFTDFGPKYKIADADGEEPAVRVITDIFIGKDSYVKVNEEDKPHGLREDIHSGWFEISGVNGCDAPAGKPLINGLWVFQPYFEKRVTNGKEVRMFSNYKASLGNLEGYGPYISGGMLTQKKQPLEKNHHSWEESCLSPELPFTDGSKFDTNPKLHTLFLAILEFQDVHHSLPTEGDIPEMERLVSQISESVVSSASSLKRLVQKSSIDTDLWKKLLPYIPYRSQPMGAVFGGIVAQEVMKVAGKYTPLDQFLYLDWMEALPDAIPADRAPKNSRYDDLIGFYGRSFVEKLGNAKIFLAGCGALGCELLKNFALLGISAGPSGLVTITDNDHIEISNLNRQFLFREQDVGKPKSLAAANSVRKMNQALKVHSLQEYIGPSTEHIFHEQFWSGLDVVINALDNVPTRQYIDNHCVMFGKPMIDAGTLSTKCNSIVVVPKLTQSFVDGPIMSDDGGIPMCTLRNFPSLIDHCIEWARSLFNDIFVEPCRALNAFSDSKDRFLEDVLKKTVNETNPGIRSSNVSKYLDTFMGMDDTLGIYQNRSFEVCLRLAFDKFHTLFRDRILSLQKQFPEDFVSETGERFWSGAKRFPQFTTFDPENEQHMKFIISTANILAVCFGLVSPAGFISEDHDWRNPSFVKQIIAKFTPRPFVYEETKIQEGESEKDLEKIQAYVEKYRSLKGVRVEVIDFEKDEDRNFHIDFITAACNLRADNYHIPQVPFHKVKIIAGKILPAIATATAMITGFNMFEFFKLMLNKPADSYRNSYNNLGINQFLFEIPDPPLKAADSFDPILMEEVKCVPPGFTKWDKINIQQGSLTMGQFLEAFHQATGLTITSLLHMASVECGGRMLYDDSPYDKKQKALYESKMSVPLEQWIADCYQPVDVIRVSITSSPPFHCHRNPQEGSTFVVLDCTVKNDSEEACKVPTLYYYWK